MPPGYKCPNDASHNQFILVEVKVNLRYDQNPGPDGSWEPLEGDLRDSLINLVIVPRGSFRVYCKPCLDELRRMEGRWENDEPHANKLWKVHPVHGVNVKG